MTNPYVPILVMMGVAAALALGGLGASAIIGPKRYNRAKVDAYECGIQPTPHAARGRFPVKYYLVAMTFIIFDIEVVFLYPWAVVFKQMLGNAATANLIFFAMISFLGVLVVGYLYAVKKRAFDWRS